MTAIGSDSKKRFAILFSWALKALKNLPKIIVSYPSSRSVEGEGEGGGEGEVASPRNRAGMNRNQSHQPPGASHRHRLLRTGSCRGRSRRGAPATRPRCSRPRLHHGLRERT